MEYLIFQFPGNSRVAIVFVLVLLIAGVIWFSPSAEAVAAGDDPRAKNRNVKGENADKGIEYPFYLPEQVFLVNRDDYLSGPKDGKPLEIALDYLNAQADQFRLKADDLSNAKVSSMYRDEDTGITHIYFRQEVSGLEVWLADISIHIAASGEVICVGGGFVRGVPDALADGTVKRAPSISAEEAVLHAAKALGLTPTSGPEVSSMSPDGEKSTIEAPGVSLEPIPAELRFVPVANGAVVLSW